MANRVHKSDGAVSGTFLFMAEVGLCAVAILLGWYFSSTSKIGASPIKKQPVIQTHQPPVAPALNQKSR